MAVHDHRRRRPLQTQLRAWMTRVRLSKLCGHLRVPERRRNAGRLQRLAPGEAGAVRCQLPPAHAPLCERTDRVVPPQTLFAPLRTRPSALRHRGHFGRCQFRAEYLSFFLPNSCRVCLICDATSSVALRPPAGCSCCAYTGPGPCGPDAAHAAHVARRHACVTAPPP